MDVHEVLAVVVSSRRNNDTSTDRMPTTCAQQEAAAMHGGGMLSPPSPPPLPPPSPTPYFSSPFARVSMDATRPLPIPRASFDGPLSTSGGSAMHTFSGGGAACGASNANNNNGAPPPISLTRLLSSSIFAAGSLSHNSTSSVSPSISPHSPLPSLGHTASVPAEFGWGDRDVLGGLDMHATSAAAMMGSEPVRDMMAKNAGAAIAGGLLSRSLADRRADRRAAEAAAQAAAAVPRAVAVFDDTWGIMHHADMERHSN